MRDFTKPMPLPAASPPKPAARPAIPPPRGVVSLQPPGHHAAGHAQQARPHGGAHGKARRAKGVFLGLGQHIQRIARLLLIQHVPEGLVVVGILVAHIAVQRRGKGHLGIKGGRYAVADGQQLTAQTLAGGALILAAAAWSAWPRQHASQPSV